MISMEDHHVKPLKPVAVVSVVAASALALAGCSAGQITQTSSQVAAVDGANATTENGEIALRDVTVILDETGQAALKFTATNQDTSGTSHVLQSAQVNGQPVNLENTVQIDYNCAVVADSADGLDRMPQSDSSCIEYVTTSLANDDFAYGGNADVSFTFDAGTVDLKATIAAPDYPSGEVTRVVGVGAEDAH